MKLPRPETMLLLADGKGNVVDFPLLPEDKPSSADVMAALNELRQIIHQLGENYSKLYVATFPVTDCKGLARILGKNESTIRRWTDDRIIPAYKVPTGDRKFTYLYNLKRVEERLQDEYST